jgi:NAD(P)-dependent dehydrogenase (short-subunit alcohol dehydrogenase family)
VAFGPLTGTSDEVLETMFATNVLGPLHLVRAALPHMKSGFVVVQAEIAEIGWLYLSVPGHRRARFIWQQGAWKGRWIAP